MNPVAQVRNIRDGEDRYEAIVLWCPGCQYPDSEDGRMRGGLNMLPIDRVNPNGSEQPRPTWGWNGDLVNVSLTPSVLTHTTRGPEKTEFRCHSFLKDGRWQFLADCTHALAGQTVAMEPLPDWVVRDVDR